MGMGLIITTTSSIVVMATDVNSSLPLSQGLSMDWTHLTLTTGPEKQCHHHLRSEAEMRRTKLGEVMSFAQKPPSL